jgi:hypothetical protein
MRERWQEGVHYNVEDRGFETPCWVWARCLMESGGYGRVQIAKRVMRAHRVAFEDAFGWVPQASTSVVHHKCEVPACINPQHLEALTRREHNARHGRLVLTDEQAAEIRRRRATGETYKSLGDAFGVDPKAAHHVVHGRSFKPCHEAWQARS